MNGGKVPCSVDTGVSPKEASNRTKPIQSVALSYQLKSDRNPHESAGQTSGPLNRWSSRKARPLVFCSESLILAQDKRWRGA